jgi:hypothetical protein
MIWLLLLVNSYPELTLKYVDPNGEEIWINFTDENGNEQRVRYVNGKLYTEYKDGKGKEYTGDNKYARKVQSDLNALKSLDDFVNFKITALENSKNIHSVQMTKEGEGNGIEATGNEEDAENGVGTGSNIYYDPFNNGISSGSRRPAMVGLAHEISHAFDIDEGERSDKTNSQGVEWDEIRAIRLENRVRDKLGYAPTLVRGITDKNGFNPRRISINPRDLERSRTFNDKIHNSWKPKAIRQVKPN